MLAWRSFLRRSNPLVTSRLRSALHRHDATQPTLLAKNQLIIASPRMHVFSDASSRLETDQDRQLGRARAPPTKRHLYLVLDDHKKDYGIYKLDVDADLDGDNDGSGPATAPRRLPHPALIRLEVPEQYQSAQFAAAGGCIVATGCLPFRGMVREEDHAIVTILYNIKTAALSFATHPSETLHDGYVLAVPVGNRLYVFDWHSDSDISLHCCCMTTTEEEDSDDDADADGGAKQGEWCWWADSGSSRCAWNYCGKSRREQLPSLPFSPRQIQAYAVHPRGRTIFVSAPGDEQRSAAGSYSADTFAYDTTGDEPEWTHRGRWALPFIGHAGYDGELDAWVGLHADDEGGDADGHLCVCHLPLPSSRRRPRRTVGREKVLIDDPEWRRLNVKLVYMVERREYCLVERLGREGADEYMGDGDECLLRLTTFRLKYKPGSLRITDRRARSYRVARYRDDFEAQAFWI